jgi:hypothetical protein
LALFSRRLSQRVVRPLSPAAENLHRAQVLPLPHRSTGDRFTSISRLYLKLIGLPEKAE